MSDIVIDADIMRSAGKSEHPHSSHARQLLEAIRDGAHRMVQCAPLNAEYRKHQGRFASAWRTSMVSRKQWVRWHYQEDADLRKTLISALPTDAITREHAVMKDAHLLEAAAATGQRIVSKDITARELFRLACPTLGAHRHILWGDLTRSAGPVIEWVKSGCAEREDYRLCPPPPKNAAQKAGKK